jgi:5,10-methylenetetrahydrofolate reductase
MIKEVKTFTDQKDIDAKRMLESIRKRKKKLDEGEFCRGSHCNSHCYHGSNSSLAKDAKELVSNVEGGAEALISTLKKRTKLESNMCNNHCWGHCKIHND